MCVSREMKHLRTLKCAASNKWGTPAKHSYEVFNYYRQAEFPTKTVRERELYNATQLKIHKSSGRLPVQA